MNEFTAKIIGELVAIEISCTQTLEKSKDAFLEIFSEDDVSTFIARAQDHEQKLIGYAEKFNLKSIIDESSAKTLSRLEEMKHLMSEDGNDFFALYDEWSIVAGLALAKWNTFKGVSETLEDDVIVDIAYDGIALHQSIYDNVVAKLAMLGRERSKAI